MKKSIKATSISEAIVVILIVVVWLTWVYNIFSQSIRLTDSVENKIQAIQIAREWIEAMTNIRDTNWLLFSSDRNNCWRTLNYNNWCIWDDSFSNIISDWWMYRIVRDTSNRWILENSTYTITPYEYSNPDYRNFYMIYLDDDWLYTHWSWSTLNNFYTREIQTNNINPWDWINENWLEIKSIVRWIDSSWREWWVVHEVVLETILTNHKK